MATSMHALCATVFVLSGFCCGVASAASLNPSTASAGFMARQGRQAGDDLVEAAVARPKASTEVLSPMYKLGQVSDLSESLLGHRVIDELELLIARQEEAMERTGWILRVLMVLAVSSTAVSAYSLVQSPDTDSSKRD
mmetsp:Transcript_100069/g.254448  ORF Transcript_100069/g.254448 Transcript_100069/m.254448 type:complete len:138 (-) Transcript_100069:340-753(-)|eukprot:CAMPEP_0183426902 /NCGR_PEP_ID=MMETSP0370-20130417/39968_1 /TAXON_ID=268820 /ORGANISM="Peridinium aciculiferum, Strain PAER-2" /LENGTH=137 /DNA_ID=CAMNT_0025611379 /DNA_START=95 /DNA_END=508 /DNA_ORIENTATION=+